MSNLLGGEQSMLEKLMAAQERIAELEASQKTQAARWRDYEGKEGLLLADRDAAVEMADKLAEKIARIENLQIGEHSSGNNPWQNALDGVSEEAW